MDPKLFQEELIRVGGENFMTMFSELWAAHKQESDERHQDNCERLKLIEENQAKINESIKALAGLVKFLKEGEEGLKWAGRVGKAVISVRQVVLWVLSGYATYVIWRNGGNIK